MTLFGRQWFEPKLISVMYEVVQRSSFLRLKRIGFDWRHRRKTSSTKLHDSGEPQTLKDPQRKERPSAESASRPYTALSQPCPSESCTHTMYFSDTPLVRLRMLSNHNQQGNARSTALRAVAKANNLDLEIVQTEPAKGVSTEYLKLNPLGRIPTFEGGDGYVLTECIAIAIYCMPSFALFPLRRPWFPIMMRNIINTVIPV